MRVRATPADTAEHATAVCLPAQLYGSAACQVIEMYLFEEQDFRLPSFGASNVPAASIVDHPGAPSLQTEPCSSLLMRCFHAAVPCLSSLLSVQQHGRCRWPRHVRSGCRQGSCNALQLDSCVRDLPRHCRCKMCSTVRAVAELEMLPPPPQEFGRTRVTRTCTRRWSAARASPRRWESCMSPSCRAWCRMASSTSPSGSTARCQAACRARRCCPHPASKICRTG